MCKWCGDGKAHAAPKRPLRPGGHRIKMKRGKPSTWSVYKHMEFIALELQNASSLTSSMCYHPLIFSYGFIFG